MYLRFGRPKVPNFISDKQEFVIGKALHLTEGKDVSIFATGHMVWHALEAAKALEKKNISAEVINIHTIKPLDEDAILASVQKTGCAVVAEEHEINGGLGESIARLLAGRNPAPVEFVAVMDVFGQSGKPEELLKLYGLDAEHIAAAAVKAHGRKS